MPLRTIGKEVTRGTICKDTFRAQVTIACSDRIPAGEASRLYLNVQWRRRRNEGEVPGQPDDARPITLTLRKLTAAASGEIRFDAHDGPTTKGFARDVDQFLVIFGQTATAGSTPDVGLDVSIEGELQATVNLSVGPVATTLAIRAENGVDEPGFFILPDTQTRLTAVATPASPGIFGWVSAHPDLLLGSPVTTPTVGLSVRSPGGPLPPVADRSMRLAALFTPDSGEGSVMAVHELFPIYNPDEPGPFPVGRAHYPNSAFAPAEMTLPAGLDNWPDDIQVPLEALVRYPAESAGDDTPFSPRHSKYPLIILAHGRHGASEVERETEGDFQLDVAGKLIPIKDGAGNFVEFKSFEGLEYLASHLASYGFIAASINLNGRFDPTTGEGELVAPSGTVVSCRPYIREQAAITHRGLVVLRHIQAFHDLNNDDPIFQNRVDLDRIGLVGHSRGGEAVVSAQETNKTVLLPIASDEKIRAIVSIAPTDDRNLTLDVPYLLLVGTDDGDVRNLAGLRIYDRAQPPKQGVIAVGAIHNFFSTNWQWQDEVPFRPAFGRQEHQAVATGYCNLFFQHHLNGVGGEAPYFTGERRFNIPGPPELHFLFRTLNGLVVDSFEDAPADKLKNALNGTVTPNNIASFDEVDLHPRTAACGFNPPWCQDTLGLMVEWNTLTARYDSAVGGQSAQAFEALSFRVGQDGSVNPAGAAQDFKVRLTDADGRNATLKVSDFGTVPPVHTKKVIRGRTAKFIPISDTQEVTMLKTIRIPLQRFRQQNADLRLDALASVSFVFDEKVPGKLAFDDIEFSH